MTRVDVTDPKMLSRLIREDVEQMQMDVRYGIVAAAHVGQRIIRSVVPVDTGNLRRETVVDEFPNGFASSVVAEIVEKTPYAAAMECGTRPFTPPFNAILAWAMRQAPNLGLGSNVKASKAAGRDIAKALAAARRADRVGKRARFRGGGVSFDREVARAALDRKVAANKPILELARRVWMSIRTKGIKAKWHTRDSQGKIRAALGRCVARAVHEHRPAGAR